jgi:predicted  nucleic acid-binding Zn-ribbon protein
MTKKTDTNNEISNALFTSTDETNPFTVFRDMISNLETRKAAAVTKIAEGQAELQDVKDQIKQFRALTGTATKTLKMRENHGRKNGKAAEQTAE